MQAKRLALPLPCFFKRYPSIHLSPLSPLKPRPPRWRISSCYLFSSGRSCLCCPPLLSLIHPPREHVHILRKSEKNIDNKKCHFLFVSWEGRHSFIPIVSNGKKPIKSILSYIHTLHTKTNTYVSIGTYTLYIMQIIYTYIQLKQHKHMSFFSFFCPNKTKHTHGFHRWIRWPFGTLTGLEPHPNSVTLAAHQRWSNNLSSFYPASSVPGR